MEHEVKEEVGSVSWQVDAFESYVIQGGGDLGGEWGGAGGGGDLECGDLEVCEGGMGVS